MQLFNADFREILPTLNVRADLICADLPFGKTKNPWDTIIPFEEVWEAFSHVSHEGTVFAMNAQMPFSSTLHLSNHKMFRYDIIWAKEKGTDFMNAGVKPLNAHEQVLIFCKKKTLYNPQKTTGHKRKVSTASHKRNSKKTTNYGEHGLVDYDSTERYPTTVWTIPRDIQKCAIHPTQKPVALLDRLILSYTDAGMTVIDPCMGSGTTGVSANNLGRNFIGIEKDPDMFIMAQKRINGQI